MLRTKLSPPLLPRDLPALAVAVAALAAVAAAAQDAPPPATPHDIHDRLAWELEDAEAEFGLAIADRGAVGSETVGPFPLPEVLNEPGDGNRPMTVSSHRARYERRLAGIWREEVAKYAAARPLTEDERRLLDQAAEEWAGGEWSDRSTDQGSARPLPPVVERVRSAGTNDPLTRAYLEWRVVSRITSHDREPDDLAALNAACGAVLNDAAAPAFLRAAAQFGRSGGPRSGRATRGRRPRRSRRR